MTNELYRGQQQQRVADWPVSAANHSVCVSGPACCKRAGFTMRELSDWHEGSEWGIWRGEYPVSSGTLKGSRESVM